ncbi:ATP-binding protein [Prevotella melaninogenica]|uniref:ATP-binding protein n=1 Tax=Prevotella melaninogenica TaxID=28132 RepID=UPI001BACC312|nr:ATP-binding protein [Prevotella melaninogenica]QUB69693.1 ATP-binding protein [Prevotella melaninogenica]
MKTINLKNLVDSYKSLSIETLSSYLGFYGIELAEKGKNCGLSANELDCMTSFIELFKTTHDSISLLDNFFVGYIIPQIGKEFDLLRFNKTNVVNIELKSKASEEKILKQLKRNRYYLQFLDREVSLFTYVQETEKLYMLDKEHLTPVSFDDLYKELIKDCDEFDDINKLFNPSNYLISPFNSTKKFMEEEYFLTEHQEEIKTNVMKVVETSTTEFMALTGAAGTGKTLLTYDIAKELRNKGKRVLIVHCAQLNSGQRILQNNYEWDICMAKTIKDTDLTQYDIIIVDEAQRIYQAQFNDIKVNAEEKKIKCIFSFDEKQYLHNNEKSRNMAEKISEILTQPIYKLTDKIRTNKEIASFIKPLFDCNEKLSNLKYANIDLCYCSQKQEVILLSKHLQEKGWKIPRYTPGTRSIFCYEGYGTAEEESAHAVIGQEFDKVVAIIDNYFEYDDNGKLKANNSYYSQRQMLYQILTRTRQKLYIIILNNEPMLKRCLEILKR